jgi:hypothetical protein
MGWDERRGGEGVFCVSRVMLIRFAPIFDFFRGLFICPVVFGAC